MAVTAPDAKRALRTRMREVRRHIASDPADRLARSARIWARVVALAQLDAAEPGSRRVMLFESLPTEPDTTAWSTWCRQRGLAVFTPAVDGPDLRVEPGGLDPVELDVVVVPGLAFTADGRRLGQGGGHYDRFLPRLRDDCVTIGAAFVEQLVDDLPTESHDVHLTYVATDA